MKTITIRFHNGKIPDHVIGGIPDDVPSDRVVSRIQAAWACHELDGRWPAVTWQVVDGGIVEGLIASCSRREA